MMTRTHKRVEWRVDKIHRVLISFCFWFSFGAFVAARVCVLATTLRWGVCALPACFLLLLLFFVTT